MQGVTTLHIEQCGEYQLQLKTIKASQSKTANFFLNSKSDPKSLQIEEGALEELIYFKIRGKKLFGVSLEKILYVQHTYVMPTGLKRGDTCGSMRTFL
jgi:hypothetical protein